MPVVEVGIEIECAGLLDLPVARCRSRGGQPAPKGSKGGARPAPPRRASASARTSPRRRTCGTTPWPSWCRSTSPRGTRGRTKRPAPSVTASIFDTGMETVALAMGSPVCASTARPRTATGAAASTAAANGMASRAMAQTVMRVTGAGACPPGRDGPRRRLSTTSRRRASVRRGRWRSTRRPLPSPVRRGSG